jgi:hypothetical protein
MAEGKENPTRGRGIYIPDDEYEDIVRETINVAQETGRPISISKWMRTAAQEKIQRERARRSENRNGQRAG